MSSYVVCKVNPDGSVRTTTTIPDDLTTSTAFAQQNGGEVVSKELAQAFGSQNKPAEGSLITTDSFRERLAPAFLRIALAPEIIQNKWDRILNQLLPPTKQTVNLASSTTVQLIGVAVQDQILTAAEGNTVVGYPGGPSPFGP